LVKYLPGPDLYFVKFRLIINHYLSIFEKQWKAEMMISHFRPMTSAHFMLKTLFIHPKFHAIFSL